MPKSTKKEASIKEKKFIKHYVKHGNATQAVLDAGYNCSNRNSAGSLGHDMLKKPRVQEELRMELEAAGLGERYLSETLKEVIERGKSRKATASDALRAVDMVLKLKDMYPGKKSEEVKMEYKMKLQGKTIEEIMDELAQVRAEREAIIGETVATNEEDIATLEGDIATENE